MIDEKRSIENSKIGKGSHPTINGARAYKVKTKYPTSG